MQIFCYGSNMLSKRIQERVPSARPIGLGRLAAHKLAWHKRSDDGSGKCDIEKTDVAGDFVLGVIYEVDAAEKPQLDAAEGKGYGQTSVDVETPTGSIRALTYKAENIDAARRPYHWYKAFVVAGAREHGMPEGYLLGLEATGSIEDPNPIRKKKNEELLKGWLLSLDG